MSETHGASAALGIEAVECFSEGGRNLVVRVSGRWRRRRPDWQGQPMLVVETEARRHRFPAMPEPPSLTGAVPGTWRMTFSVPAELEPYLTRGASLQLGAAVVPLPLSPTAQRAGRALPLDPELLAARQLRGSELALESARRRAAQAEAVADEMRTRVEQLERELEEAARESERLSALVAAREREVRLAEQLTHSERAQRIEASERLAERERAHHALRHSLQRRIRELERDIERARRAADEARHLAEAASAGRTEGGTATAREPAGPRRQRLLLPAEVMRSELELARVRAAVDLPRPARSGEGSRSDALLGAEQQTIRGWRRAELERVRHDLDDQRRRSAQVYQRIGELRREIAELRAASGQTDAAADPAAPAGRIETERFSEALARLREQSVAERSQTDASTPRRSRLGTVVRRLTGRLRRLHD